MIRSLLPLPLSRGRMVMAAASRMRAAPLVVAVVLAPFAAIAEAWMPQRVAELQALDKVTARISTLRVPLEQPQRFGTLTLTVRACHARPPEEVPDASAWLEISDSRAPANGAPVFRGWMFANAPGVNMLQHPVYDIRLMECRAG